jgi:uncharacterized protein YqeY
VIDVLRKSIKRRRESAEMYTKGNRKDLADKETSEAAALEKYLPAQVSDEELRAAVKAAIAGGATQIGAVMGKVLPQFKGRAEGGTINAIAREELSKSAFRVLCAVRQGRPGGITKPELAMTLASSGFVVLGYYDR